MGIQIANFKVNSENDEEEEEEEEEVEMEEVPEPEFKKEDGWEDAQLDNIEASLDQMKTSTQAEKTPVNVADGELADKTEEKGEEKKETALKRRRKELQLKLE